MTLYKFSVGAVLAVAMGGVLTMSALAFSSRDFQFGVAQVAPSTNGRVDFAAMEEIDREVAEIRARTRETREEFTEVQERIAALDRVEAEASQARAEIVGDVARIEEGANVQAGAGAGQTTQALSTRINALAGNANIAAADQQRVATLAADVSQLAQQEGAVAANAPERARLTEQYRLVGDQVAQADSEIHTLQARAVSDYQFYDRIRNEAKSLESMSILGISAHLAQGHPSLLSTLLVLLMGALGTLLYLFPAYLNRPEPVTMGEVFVRLVFGMCAALSLYILANAAIAGFSIGSGGGAAGTTTPVTAALLNPFTVSLVGIVAGVLSEDIAKWIQERGRGVLGGAAAQPAARAPAAAPERAPTGGLVNNDAISG